MAMDTTAGLSAYWMIFSLSFLVALTGAMAPGPLLTYTIVRAAGSRRRGYLMGVWVIIGHALLELGIITVLLFGFSYLLQKTSVVRFIGAVGGVILVWFGVSIIRDIIHRRIPTTMDTDTGGADHAGDAAASDQGGNPVVGGALVSMANPYWWVWWATIGFAFMVEFNITYERFPRLLAFFLGHEAGDLIWYVIVSTLAYFGLRRLNTRVYYGILAVCGLFMIGFGLYLGASPFIKPVS